MDIENIGYFFSGLIVGYIVQRAMLLIDCMIDKVKNILVT